MENFNEMDGFETYPESEQDWSSEWDAYSEFETDDELEQEDSEEEWEAEFPRRRRMAMVRAGRSGPRRSRPPQRQSAKRPRSKRPPGLRPSHPRPRPRPHRRPVRPCVCPAHGTEFVRWVQSSLNQILGEKLIVNGIMSRASRSALRRFQQQQGLPADGIAGPDTERALLDARGGRVPTDSNASTPVDTPADAAEFEFDEYEDEFLNELDDEFEWEDEVSRGSREYIIWVQSSLNRILGTRLATDGISGPLTRSAIRSFQAQKGLTADGIVGPVTEAALIAAGAGQPPGMGATPAPGGGRADSSVNVELPLSGPGFYSYDRTSAKNGQPHQFGRRETIDAIKAIGTAWQRAYPRGPRIGIGHISLRGGGDTPSHAGHETGLEVDIRPMRNDGMDGVNARVTINDSYYSHELTRKLVDTIRANRVLGVSRIRFNDRNIPGVIYTTGHDNHLHVDFSAPPAARGYF